MGNVKKSLAEKHVIKDNIKPVNDQVPSAKVDSNTTPDSTNMCHRGGEIDQDAEQYKKPPLQPFRNHSVVRQMNAFKSERPRISKPRFASQVDEKIVLLKPVTPYYLPKVREYVRAKPHHMNAPGSSRNSQEESYSSNDMAHNHDLEEARKKAQETNRNSKPSVMPSVRLQNTANEVLRNPREQNKPSSSLPTSKRVE
ncbi:hypothetical protein Tco_0843500 [Tanacetum coccineum]|uniref:Uncharacterized protein n=1 Tax=Tanacetum coccineum TaxID=301880 RepID=A0ABQ5B3H0_9ASTR